MKHLVCTYCEHNETKLVVFSRDNGKIKIHRSVSINTSQIASGELTSSEDFDLATDSLASDVTFDSYGSGDIYSSSQGEVSFDVGELAANLYDINLSGAEFVPVVSDPILSYHIFAGEEGKDKKKFKNQIIEDIQNTKGLVISQDSLDYIDYSENEKLVAFIEDGIPCVEQINALAKINNKRYYKIPTVKSSDVALAHLVTSANNFFPEDYSLIIYTGKEFSKLIFLEGNKLKHIGTPLDIGTENLHTYDVYFSKILLEMENGGIPRLDNVILCGEDNSENLVLSFYGTFPEADVSQLNFEMFDMSFLSEEDQEVISAFAIPMAAALEYYDEADKNHRGINLLPKYIKDNQKVLTFGWHSFAVLPLLFLAAFYFTFTILSQYKEIDQNELKIKNLTELQIQNQTIIDSMTVISGKVENFGRTQAILDSASIGTEVWSKTIDKISTFVERRRNFWVSKIQTLDQRLIISGHSMSRKSLTEFTDFNNNAMLQNIIYDPLREKNTFAFLLECDLFKEQE